VFTSIYKSLLQYIQLSSWDQYRHSLIDRRRALPTPGKNNRCPEGITTQGITGPVTALHSETEAFKDKRDLRFASKNKQSASCVTLCVEDHIGSFQRDRYNKGTLGFEKLPDRQNEIEQLAFRNIHNNRREEHPVEAAGVCLIPGVPFYGGGDDAFGELRVRAIATARSCGTGSTPWASTSRLRRVRRSRREPDPTSSTV
jgi:hypothetical protein